MTCKTKIDLEKPQYTVHGHRIYNLRPLAASLPYTLQGEVNGFAISWTPEGRFLSGGISHKMDIAVPPINRSDLKARLLVAVKNITRVGVNKFSCPVSRFEG